MVEAAVDAVDIVAQVDGDPARVGVDAELDLDGDAVRQERLEGIVRALGRDLGLGQRLDRLHHAALRIVEPLVDEGLDRVLAVLGAELLQAPLGDARRAELCQEVAVPLLGHANPAPAHADHVVHHLVAPLHADAGEDQRAFLVHVLRRGVIGGRDAVADVRLMALGAGGEEVLAIDEDRHQHRVIGRVGIAEIGVVVEERVALGEIVVQFGHGPCLQVRAEDMDRQTLRRRQELVVGGADRAREIPRHGDHGRARCLEQRVRHLAHDAVEPVGEHREKDRVQRLGRLRRLCHLSRPPG